jgi:pimeloyl-ACP methyl ester carboxylesterase
MPRTIHAAAALALLAALALPTAALAAPASAAGARGAPARPAPRTLAWHGCATKDTVPNLQCATLRVPLDWARPNGARISIAVDRIPASDRAHRIGSLLFNPGGPGGPGVATVAAKNGIFAIARLKPLTRRYDIIGFDPRGVGASTPIRCGGSLHDPKVTAFPRTTAQYDRLVRLNRAAGAACRAKTGPLIDHVDTVSAARDVDAIRAGLGERKISWLGVSYGSEFGQTYARLFPGRVRRMVIDGIVDHQRSVRRDAVDEARSIEQGFGHFADWCARTTSCALHSAGVRKVFAGLVDRAGGVPASKYHRNATAEEITNGAYGQMYFPAAWPDLAKALAAARGDAAHEPDASALLASTTFADPVYYGAYRTISCHDFPGRVRGLAGLRQRESAVRRAAPTMWRYSEFWDMTSGCLGWPVRAQYPPGPSAVRGTPPILVVGNTSDPATPYVWARAVHRQVAGSRLLTYDGDGHTALLNSGCAQRREAAYLTTGALPPRGATCRS